MIGAARDRLVIFTRFPQPGAAKTRLIPMLGADGAAELHRRMTAHTLSVAGNARALIAGLDVVVRFSGGTPEAMKQLYGASWRFEEQGEGDLGARMERAVRDAFAEGRMRTLIIGTDCPELTGALLRAAFDALADADLVLGPARDGGYYLIGLRRAAPELFAGMPWGSGEVFERTRAEARRIGLEVRILPTLSDVDTPQDLGVVTDQID